MTPIKQAVFSLPPGGATMVRSWLPGGNLYTVLLHDMKSRSGNGSIKETNEPSVTEMHKESGEQK